MMGDEEGKVEGRGEGRDGEKLSGEAESGKIGKTWSAKNFLQPKRWELRAADEKKEAGQGGKERKGEKRNGRKDRRIEEEEGKGAAIPEWC